MKSCLLKFSAFILLLFSISLSGQIDYPETVEIPVHKNYHGTEITDNYQWLEQGSSQEVVAWVEAQNRVSEKYFRKMLRSRETDEDFNKYMFRKVGEYEGKNLTTFAKDNYYFTFYYPDHRNTPSLYYRKGYRGKDKILVDSDAISERDEIILKGYSTSRNNQYLAYSYSRNGSDWNEIKIVEPAGRKHHSEVLRDSRGGVLWLNKGFFYTKYPEASLMGKAVFPEIRYHELGQVQEQDRLIFKANNDKEFLSMFRSPDEDMFVIRKEDFEKKSFSYYYLDPQKTELSLRPLLLNIPYDIYFSHFDGESFLAVTDIKNNTHLVTIPLETPQNLKIISPNYADPVYKGHVVVGDKIVLALQGLKNDILALLDHKGKVLQELSMPPGISVSDLEYREEFGEILFEMGSYTIPGVLCKLDLENFEYEVVEQTEVNFDFKDYKFLDTLFTSHDGTKVPIFIVYKKELKKNGSIPFLLKTYGGYGALDSPSYDPGAVYFIENGGAFGYVHVRGGGKLGNNWWEAGKGLTKKNSFLDLISGAEFLIGEGYTSPKKVAITGASHGGMVAAAAAITRPDLFGAAAIDVGALDMLRFEEYSVGSTATNLSEFGSVKNKVDFENLFSYSPYHNVREGVNYPSMLLITGSHDNRVPPFHSYKMAARLQGNSGQKNPVLLWTQKKTGHFGANNMNDKLKEYSFLYGFLFNELLQVQKNEL